MKIPDAWVFGPVGFLGVGLCPSVLKLACWEGLMISPMRIQPPPPQGKVLAAVPEPGFDVSLSGSGGCGCGLFFPPWPLHDNKFQGRLHWPWRTMISE